jgi:hypothetical protein
MSGSPFPEDMLHADIEDIVKKGGHVLFVTKKNQKVPRRKIIPIGRFAPNPEVLLLRAQKKYQRKGQFPSSSYMIPDARSYVHTPFSRSRLGDSPFQAGDSLFMFHGAHRH